MRICLLYRLRRSWSGVGDSIGMRVEIYSAFQDVTDIPDISRIPGVSGLPDIPGTSGISDVPGTLDILDISDISDKHFLPSLNLFELLRRQDDHVSTLPRDDTSIFQVSKLTRQCFRRGTQI